MLNKSVNRRFFVSLRFAVASPLYRKTLQWKKCTLPWRYDWKSMKPLLSAALISLSGCSIVNSVKYQELPVTVSFDRKVPRECKKISSSYYVEHVFSLAEMKGNAIKYFTKESRKTGANYVLITKESEGWWDSRKSGGPYYGLDADIYSCAKKS